MKKTLMHSLCAISIACSAAGANAAPAVQVLGKDFTFPNKLPGMPQKLSDFEDLKINSFTTDDGVKLSYWEAGQGKPLVFVPGWSANGAEYFNIMFLLSKHYHVYVLDQRNQGLSQRVKSGSRISRYAMDLREMKEHLKLEQADYAGWSMGVSVLWNYIDLFGTSGISKLVFVDEAPSIYNHQDWTEEERKNAGATVTSPERMIEDFDNMRSSNKLIANLNMFDRFQKMDSPWFENSEKLSNAFIKNDPAYLKLVMFDHVTNDWRDVIEHKINVPVAIFSGDYSPYLDSQRWIHKTLTGSQLFVYTKEEQGDHFMMFKNPVKFADDLKAFLDTERINN